VRTGGSARRAPRRSAPRPGSSDFETTSPCPRGCRPSYGPPARSADRSAARARNSATRPTPPPVPVEWARALLERDAPGGVGLLEPVIAPVAPEGLRDLPPILQDQVHLIRARLVACIHHRLGDARPNHKPRLVLLHQRLNSEMRSVR